MEFVGWLAGHGPQRAKAVDVESGQTECTGTIDEVYEWLKVAGYRWNALTNVWSVK